MGKLSAGMRSAYARWGAAAALAMAVGLGLPATALAEPASNPIGDGEAPFAQAGVPAHEGQGAAARAGSGIEAFAAGAELDTFGIALPGTYHQTEARQLLELINQARAAVGSPALAYDTGLERAAMQRAAEIAVSFDHTRPNGDSCFTAAAEAGASYGWAAGENILMGAWDASGANALWTNSPGHYSNMIDGKFTSVGVAAIEVSGYWYWVEFFGATPGTGFDAAANDGDAIVSVQALPQYLNLVFSDVDPSDWYVAGGARNFLYTLNNGLMSGYSGQQAFGPYDPITRGQVVTILHRMAGGSEVSAPAFADVNYGEYYGNAINWARATGVVNGNEADNTFRPDAPVSREELAAMLRNYAIEIAGMQAKPNASVAAAMPDWSSVSSWARDSVAWVVGEGIMSGEDRGGVRYLNPQGSAWRASMATMAAVFHRDVLN